MKQFKQILILVLSFSLIISCSCSKNQSKDLPEQVIIRDTVTVNDTIYIKEVHSFISDKCLENELILLNIKHYVSITEKNKNNQKFFFGWIKRAISD